MSDQVIAVLLGIFAGVAAGASGIFQLKRPTPGWLFACLLAIWLLMIYAGVWR